MADEPQTPDPQDIWQNQSKESFIMSADQLRYKAQQLQRNGQVKTIFSVVLGLALFSFFAWRTLAGDRAGGAIPRLGLGLISVWCLYFAYQAYHWTWPDRLTQDTSLNTTLVTYRKELERRGDYARNIWRRAGLPLCFLGLALVVLPGLIQSIAHPELLMNFAPIIGLLVLWLVAFYFIRRRDRQKLAREIEALRAFESADSERKS